MDKKILMILIVLLSVSLVSATTIVDYKTDDLIAWYTMDYDDLFIAGQDWVAGLVDATDESNPNKYLHRLDPNVRLLCDRTVNNYGLFSGGCNFDSTGRLVQRNDVAELSSVNDKTVSFWYKQSRTSAGGFYPILTIGDNVQRDSDGSFSNLLYSIAIDNAAGNAGEGRLAMFVSDDVGYFETELGDEVNLGDWHHYSLTFVPGGGVSERTHINFYLDGTLKVSRTLNFLEFIEPELTVGGMTYTRDS